MEVETFYLGIFSQAPGLYHEIFSSLEFTIFQI